MKKFLSIAFLVLVIGCGGKTQYEDVNKAEGSMEWGPKEIKTTVNKMVSSLYTFLKDDWKKPAFIQVQKFRNMTSEHIDTELVVGEIRTRLIKQRIKFIDDSLDQEALAEIAKGQT
ncbi:MAG TPA: penicillin-binding protein activator LpoB, partial [Spirochaetota bacterium]|nr:penicillin-binding protein activator LpoB [Spirochaetota bacterium]